MSDETSVMTQVILFVQLNDLYQIDTSADYTEEAALILPRISTLVSRLRDFYGSSRVKFCLPGDFLAPSCLSKEFKGEQMVDVLNHMGIDRVSFGNHEFESVITARDLEDRINQSSFKWLNANFEFREEVLQDRLEKSDKMPVVDFIELSDSHLVVLFGVLGAKTPDDVGWVHDQKHFIKIICEGARDFKKKAMRATPARNFGLTFVAMTHQTLKEDCKLAHECPQLTLIMGGHDHNVVFRTERNRCLIVKTASNARTLRVNWLVAVPLFPPEGAAVLPDRRAEPERFREFVLNVYGEVVLKPLRYALLQTNKPSIEQMEDFYQFVEKKGFVDPSDLAIRGRVVGEELIFTISIALNTQLPAFIRLVPPDANLHGLIRGWNKKAKHSDTPLITAPVELVLVDSEVRRFSTNFGNLIADIVRGHPLLRAPSRFEAEVGLFNSGSLRIDRNIQKGEGISQRTLCDVFFHPNAINCYPLKGEELVRLLKKSLKLRNGNKREGDGNFLQISGLKVVVRDDSQMEVYKISDFGQEEAIDTTREYSVATTPYVARTFDDCFEGASEVQLDKDISTYVEGILSDLDHFVFSLVLSDEPRWTFFGDPKAHRLAQ